MFFCVVVCILFLHGVFDAQRFKGNNVERLVRRMGLFGGLHYRN